MMCFAASKFLSTIILLSLVSASYCFGATEDNFLAQVNINGANVGGARQTGERLALTNAAYPPRCQASDLTPIEGWLIDLDGTVNNWTKLLPGVTELFDWISATNASIVLASNGMRSVADMVAKYKRPEFKIDYELNSSNLFSAGMALSKYVGKHVPKGSKVFVMSTSSNSVAAFLAHDTPKDIYATWEVKSNLTTAEVSEWSNVAVNGGYVCVILAFGDGWPDNIDYWTLQKASMLLRNGAHFIVGGTDVTDLANDAKFPNVTVVYPWLGSFEKFVLAAAEVFPGTPDSVKLHHNIAKGGNLGKEYMMMPAIELLKKRNPKITLEKVAIIGDNLGTDIYAANDAGIKSVLVLSGIHKLEDVPKWKQMPTCYLDSVADIPKIAVAKSMNNNGSSRPQWFLCHFVLVLSALSALTH